jgi:uncharacterized delta-60 repeat protein
MDVLTMKQLQRHITQRLFQSLTLASALLVGAFAIAQTAGSFDTSFGSGGIIKNLVPAGSGDAFGEALALQPDGKILIGGACTGAAGDVTCLTRRLPNGGVDLSLSFQFDGITNSRAERLIVAPDGRIVIGAGCNAGSVRVCIARLNSDGGFDTSFDGGVSGNGRLSFTGIGGFVSMLLQPDGKLIVVSYCVASGMGGFCVMRLNADGTDDTAFDGPDLAGTGVGASNGRVRLSLYGLGIEQPTAMALQTDGKIVVVGTCLGSSGYGLCVVRLNANGSFDLSFDGASGVGNGRTIFNINGSDQAVGQGVALAPDGRIVVAGLCGNSSASYRFCGARLLPNGAFDPEFLGTAGNTPGQFRFAILGDRAEMVRSLVIQPDGRILLAGLCENTPVPMFNGNDFCFARLNSDGSFDRSFDGPNGSANGRFATAIANDFDLLYHVAIQPDGKFLASGTCSDTCGGSCGGNAFCIARFHGGSQGYETCSLDIDGDGTVGTSDALLHARVALGFKGDALVGGVSFAANALRTNSSALRDHLITQCGMVSP